MTLGRKRSVSACVRAIALALPVCCAGVASDVAFAARAAKPGPAPAPVATAPQPNDWMLGAWTAQAKISGFAPAPFTVTFIRSGNEIRGVFSGASGNDNLMRGVTDNFGVTTWQAWYDPMPPGGPCGSQPGQWVQATVQFSPDHHAIQLYSPIRNGMPPCGASGTTAETDLTR